MCDNKQNEKYTKNNDLFNVDKDQNAISQLCAFLLLFTWNSLRWIMHLEQYTKWYTMRRRWRFFLCFSYQICDMTPFVPFSFIFNSVSQSDTFRYIISIKYCNCFSVIPQYKKATKRFPIALIQKNALIGNFYTTYHIILCHIWLSWDECATGEFISKFCIFNCSKTKHLNYFCSRI